MLPLPRTSCKRVDTSEETRAHPRSSAAPPLETPITTRARHVNPLGIGNRPPRSAEQAHPCATLPLTKPIQVGILRGIVRARSEAAPSMPTLTESGPTHRSDLPQISIRQKATACDCGREHFRALGSDTWCWKVPVKATMFMKRQVLRGNSRNSIKIVYY